ncbi:MAG: TVP38/TMEM64 family protein [Conexibacter sp.]
MSSRERSAALRLLVLAVAVCALFGAVALSGGLTSERIRDALDGLGWAGPPLFVVVSTALTVALFPGPLLAGASGLLFGTAVGTPTSIVAATLGASAAFCISRRFGAGAVDELSGHRLRVVQDWIAARGFVAVLYARILPGMPFTIVNYAAGLTRVRLAVFAGATAIGCAPRAFAYTALGGSLDDLGSPEALVAFGVLAAMAIGGLAVASRDVRYRVSLPGWRRRPPASDVTRSSEPGTGSSSPDGRSAGRP